MTRLNGIQGNDCVLEVHFGKLPMLTSMNRVIRAARSVARSYWHAGEWDRKYGFWLSAGVILGLLAFVFIWSALN